MYRQLARVGARTAVRRVAWVLVGILGQFQRRKPVPAGDDVRRILLVRLDLLGDVLFSLSAVAPLRRRYPQAEITMLTLPYTAPLAVLEPAVHRVVSLDTNRIRTLRGLIDPATWTQFWSVYRELRSQRFDLALSLSGPMASLWCFLSGARQTVGYQAEAYPDILTDTVPGGRFGERIHDVEYVLRLAEAAGASETRAPLHVEVPESAVVSVEALLAERGVSVGDPLVIVHAGSLNGSAKRWPARNWGAFARALRHGGARVLLVGAASDRVVASDVLAAAGDSAESLVGETSVEQLLAVIARADLVATGDSGPLHLAVALGRPLVAAYGPTDPSIHGPYRPTAPVRVHRHDLACSPCYSMAASAECPLGDPICMRLITVEEMVTSALELLRLSPERR